MFVPSSLTCAGFQPSTSTRRTSGERKGEGNEQKRGDVDEDLRTPLDVVHDVLPLSIPIPSFLQRRSTRRPSSSLPLSDSPNTVELFFFFPQPSDVALPFQYTSELFLSRSAPPYIAGLSGRSVRVERGRFHVPLPPRRSFFSHERSVYKANRSLSRESEKQQQTVEASIIIRCAGRMEGGKKPREKGKEEKRFYSRTFRRTI
jgi:hypothetical protein